MKKLILATTFVALTSVFGMNSFANAATVEPCEDVLVKLNDAMAKATLNDVDAKAVADLKAKGEERCTAEDDRRADQFLSDAIAIVTKK